MKLKEEHRFFFFFRSAQKGVVSPKNLNQNRVNEKTFSSIFLPRETLAKRSCPKASLDTQWPHVRLPSHPSPKPVLLVTTLGSTPTNQLQ